MVFTLENELLQVRVEDRGAQLIGVLDKRYNLERIWQAESRAWQSHAPLLFPYCGRLHGKKMKIGDKEYPAPNHGFARISKFACVDEGGERLVFRLCDNEETREYYPFPFELTVTFTLDGEELRQKVEVRNPGNSYSLEEDLLPFNIGFHPGFAMPSDSTSFDHKIEFDELESPREVMTPDGFVSGETRVRFTNQKIMPVRDAMFSRDSICLTDLKSESVTFVNGKTGRGVRVGIAGFKFVVFWGPPKGPLPFLCIEPWEGLPDPSRPYGDFMDKPGIVKLPAGESYEKTLALTFF